MPLMMSLTLANGITCPFAYGVEDWNLQGSKNIGQITITWWADKVAHDNHLPSIRTDQLNLTTTEQTLGAQQLLAVLDGLVVRRPEYAAATIL